MVNDRSDVVKNCFKRLISFILILILVFSLSTAAFAEDSQSSLEQTQTTVPAEEEINPQPPASADDVVGKIYLCSRWSSITTTGHLWIYIYNTSDEVLRVGLYDLAPEEGVSIGTFGFTRSDGFGIYYNMEAYRNDKYCDDSCISLSDDLTRAELEAVTAKLLVSNHWNPIINCVFFACKIWNLSSDTRVVPYFYPPIVRLAMMAKGATEKCEMNYQPPEKSFKQRGSGEDSYLENVSQKSLDK